jgi:DNA processing protein
MSPQVPTPESSSGFETAAPADQALLARVVLSALAAAGDPAVHRLIKSRGLVAAAGEVMDRRRSLTAAAEVLPGVGSGATPGSPPEFGWLEAARLLDRAHEAGIWLLYPENRGWPSGLGALGGGIDRDNAGEPFALWVRGRGDALADMTRQSVAVVGSRAASAYGDHMAALLSGGLTDAGWTVISGGAYGIDAAAHRAALSAGGPTIAVLAGGVDVAYPARNANLLDQVARNGALLSESPPGASPRRHRFLSRNRLIAALTGGTVIVEAGLRSGALNTARHTRRLGRPLMGVPGPATSALSAGVHAMLRDHPQARVVTSPEQVLEEVGPIGLLAPVPRPTGGPRDALSAVMLDVLEAVPGFEPHLASTIGTASGQPPETVAAVLVALVDHGLVEKLSAGYRLTALGRAPVASAGSSAHDRRSG